MNKNDKRTQQINFKKSLAYFLLIFMIPFIALPVISLLTKIGANIFKSDIITIKLNKPIAIGDYVYYCLVVIGTLVTLYFSWALLKTSERSNQLSESIKLKEDKRDEEIIRNSATYIHMELKWLIYKACDMMLRYVRHNANLSSRDFEEEHKFRSAFVYYKTLGNINSEWRQHIPIIRDSLLKHNVSYEDMFKLFIDFETPIIFAKEGNLRGCVISIPREILIDDFNEDFYSSDAAF